MSRLILASTLLVCAALPARADEFTDTLESALSAYREGNVKAASEDLDYATKLLGSQKAEALARFLPPAPEGWSREDQAPDDEGMGMAMFGGGTTVSAVYAKAATEATLTLLADSPMVTSLGAMMGGLAQFSGAKPMRIQRVEFSEIDGELRGLVNNRVLVTVAGDAPSDDKKLLLEAMDFEALATY